MSEPEYTESAERRDTSGEKKITGTHDGGAVLVAVAPAWNVLLGLIHLQYQC